MTLSIIVCMDIFTSLEYLLDDIRTGIQKKPTPSPVEVP